MVIYTRWSNPKHVTPRTAFRFFYRQEGFQNVGKAVTGGGIYGFSPTQPARNTADRTTLGMAQQLQTDLLKAADTVGRYNKYVKLRHRAPNACVIVPRERCGIVCESYFDILSETSELRYLTRPGGMNFRAGFIHSKGGHPRRRWRLWKGLVEVFS